MGLPFSEGIYDKTILVGNCKHPVGDRKCGECWAGYPKVCECGGLVHGQFVRENWQNEKIVEYACDNCGCDYKVQQRKPRQNKDKGRRYPRR